VGIVVHPVTPGLPTNPTKVDGSLDVQRAVATAQLHAPAIRTARAKVDVANAGVDLANTAYLPRLDLVWQEIRATRNNISGTTFPQGVIPAISGPVGQTRSWDSGWGSNAGALLTYEPIDFGLRSATTETARLATRQAEADVRLTRLEVGVIAADAFLAHLASLQTLRAVRANFERWEVLAKAVHTLTDRELRPGSDASRSDAEVAAARTQLLLAEQTCRRAGSRWPNRWERPASDGDRPGTSPGSSAPGSPARRSILSSSPGTAGRRDPGRPGPEGRARSRLRSPSQPAARRQRQGQRLRSGRRSRALGGPLSHPS
jgi:outer membrane protein TolC